MANIQWDRNTEWVKENLVNAVTPVYEDEHTHVERTGLHEREFIDTFRVDTDKEATIHRNGSVHVMNLVDVCQAKLVSTDGSFEPFEIHYAKPALFLRPLATTSWCPRTVSPVKAIIACVRN